MALSLKICTPYVDLVGPLSSPKYLKIKSQSDFTAGEMLGRAEGREVQRFTAVSEI